MSDVGGVSSFRPIEPTVVPQQAERAAPAQETKQTPQLDSKQFAQVKSQVKLPTTNVNALTQLPAKDQMQLMKLAQDNNLGKFVQTISNARKQIESDVPPRSMLGAGQSIPPAPMRAIAAAMGKVFSGRDFEIEIGRENTQMSFRVAGKSFNTTIKTPLKRGAKSTSEDDEEEDVEESL